MRDYEFYKSLTHGNMLKVVSMTFTLCCGGRISVRYKHVLSPQRPDSSSYSLRDMRGALFFS